MRADRLISLMLTLHTKGRCTAQELAEQLEVSERTIYRDLEALGVAGIPVYAQSGPNGGIYLDEHYRVSLTGLSLKEAQGLLIRNDSDPVKDLGLTNTSTLLKLLAALPSGYRSEVERMRERFYVDSEGWLQANETIPFLPVLQQAVWEDQRIEADYQPYDGFSKARQLDAYGLVAKAGIWYLVAKKVNDPIDEPHTYRVSRFKGVTLTQTHFERDPHFDLVSYWQSACERFAQSTVSPIEQPFTAVIRVHPNAFWYFPRHLEGFYERHEESDTNGWIKFSVQFFSTQDARMNLFRLGTEADVLEPLSLRQALVKMARELIDHYNNQ